MAHIKFYIEKLNSEFNQRIKRNPSYSIRSYARDLDIDSSSLSSIMNGKRKIPKSKIEDMASKTCTVSEELKAFIESAEEDHITLKTIKSKDALEDRHVMTEEEFASISDIHTYTLLSMLGLQDFKYDMDWMARKLKLDKASVELKIAKLTEAGLVEEVDGTLVRTKKRTSTTDEIASKYIVKHHLDSLELAKTKCVELDKSERYFSTITIPSDPDAIGHIKKLIMEFEDKIEAYTRQLDQKDVYKLSIQFYQATEKDL